MAKRFQTLNIGAATIALAEYELGARNQLQLVNYGTAQLGASLDSGDPSTILTPALMEIMREKGIKPGKLAMSVSGQMVFPKFAAVPMAGGEEKFEQMIRYEIEQNIPFPIDEMVCDRQVLGDTENGDKAVMIVAAKVDQVEALTDAVVSAGFTPELVGASPISLTNALRASSAADPDSCVVLLDVGSKTTSLVIVEGDKLYNRSIPVAGNAITKDIAQAFGCTMDEAEALKLEKAYVSLGGVTEDEDEVADRISKICRTVMTRLNAEISRSINFYRSQQNGSAPVKLYLAGGTSLLPQLDQFFAESLQIDVEYFNPLTAISVSSNVDGEALEYDALMLGATAGLAFQLAGVARYAINLLPPSIVNARAEKAKIPFVVGGAVALVAAMVLMLLGVNHQIEVIKAQLDAVSQRANTFRSFDKRVKQAEEALAAITAEAEGLQNLISARSQMVRRMNAIRSSLVPGMWVEQYEPGRITVRSWSDKVKGTAGKTIGEQVVDMLKSKNTVIDPQSVKISNMSTVGAGAQINQFTVEFKCK